MDAPSKQHVIDPEICIRCYTCEMNCPIEAITHNDDNVVVDLIKIRPVSSETELADDGRPASAAHPSGRLLRSAVAGGPHPTPPHSTPLGRRTSDPYG